MVVWKKLSGSKGYDASVPGIGDIHVTRVYQVIVNDEVIGYWQTPVDALNATERLVAEKQKVETK